MKSFQLFLICALFFSSNNVRFLNAQPLQESIPYNRLEHFEWVLLCQIYQGAFGTMYNAVCLISMLSLDKSSKMSFYSINVYLNFIDLSFSIGRVLFSSMYYNYMYIYGEDISCRSEGYFNVWSTFTSILAIVGMSWVARFDICNGNKVTEKQMIVYIVSTSIYAAVFVGICVYIPYGGFELEPAGTFCYTKASSYAGAPLLAVNFIGWMMFLLYNVRVTYRAVKESQAILEKHAIKEQAKGRYLNMVKKMEYFLHTTLNLYLPIVAGGWYQWISEKHVTGLYSGVSGTLATLVPTLVNPSLFFYLNADLREKCWELFGYQIARFFQNLGLLGLVGKILIGKALIANRQTLKLEIASSLPSAITKVDTNIIVQGNSVSIMSNGCQRINYNDVDTWLNDAMLMEALKDHGRREFALENFLFYEDAQIYFRKALEIKCMVEESYNDNLSADNINEKWKELLGLGFKIYALYICVPTAPFEINVSATLQKKIAIEFESEENGVRCLKYSLMQGSTNRVVPFETIGPPPVLANCSQENALAIVEKYLHIFDECVIEVKEIIITDIWPRFKSSQLKREAVRKHKESRRQQL